MPGTRIVPSMTRRLFTVMIIVATLLVAGPASVAAQSRGGRGGGAGGPEWGDGAWLYPFIYGWFAWTYAVDTFPEVQLQVTPRDTEVYVDGVRRGIVSQFDGAVRGLSLLPGEHVVTLRLQGFRSWSEHRYFESHSDNRILHAMEPLAPGQADEPRPVPQDPRDMGGDRRVISSRLEPLPPPSPRSPNTPSNPRTPNRPVMPRTPDRPPDETHSLGTLSLGIEPADADVIIDGQPSPPTKSQERLIIDLTEGTHQLVIRRAGLKTFETDLQIRRGRTLALTVSLSK